MSNIHLIQLTPLGEFFFGGEDTFGPDTNRHYFVRSRLFPQQTSLLGLLRYELLKSEAAVFDLTADRIIDPAGAARLVGAQGFDALHNKAFGIIEGLSPVFLLDPLGRPFFMRAKFRLEGAGKTWLSPKTGEGLAFSSVNLLQDSPKKDAGFQLMFEKQLQDGSTTQYAYDGKTSFSDQLVSSDGTIVPLHFDASNAADGVFIRMEKTGNRKQYNGGTDESGFYKQHMYKLRTGWRFGFLAAFNQSLPQGFGAERRTYFGAEKRPFLLRSDAPGPAYSGITFKDGAFDNFGQLYGASADAPAGLSQTVLISDACAGANICQHADFAIVDTLPFRHFRPSLVPPNTLWADPKNEPKSRKYNLLRKGGSFFARSPQDIHNALSAQGAFVRIGYNYFKTITQ